MATVLSKRCDKPEEILQAILDVEKDGVAIFEIQKHCDHYTLSYFCQSKKINGMADVNAVTCIANMGLRVL